MSSWRHTSLFTLVLGSANGIDPLEHSNFVLCLEQIRPEWRRDHQTAVASFHRLYRRNELQRQYTLRDSLIHDGSIPGCSLDNHLHKGHIIPCRQACNSSSIAYAIQSSICAKIPQRHHA